MSFRIRVADTALSFACREGQSVLAAMSQAGQKCLTVGCRSGGCGVCRVQVVEGEFETGLMSHSEVCTGDRAKGIVLACQLFPRSELEVRVLGRNNVDTTDPTAALLRRVFAAASAAPASSRP
uniref:2Fe-2S ferredoxin-type domain-containing protein n=1 Tax=uncultured bacterium 16 TaxID=1748268 RepID=A0A0U3JGF1_9BACT|nr:hypothetical protein [uncultured bacterium 16]